MSTTTLAPQNTLTEPVLFDTLTLNHTCDRCGRSTAAAVQILVNVDLPPLLLCAHDWRIHAPSIREKGYPYELADGLDDDGFPNTPPNLLRDAGSA